MDPSEFLFNIAAPMLIALAIASRGFRTDERYLATWARSAGLELTAETGPVVQRHLAWTRMCRTVGGLIGFMSPVVVAALMTEDPLQDGGWSLPSMLIGYLLGAFFAEFVGGHRDPRAGRAPGSRHLGDYLPAPLLVIQRGLGIVSGSLAIAYPFFEPHALPSLHLPGPAVVGAFGVAGVSIAALLELLERTIALRRRPLSGMEPAIEGALTSSSIHAVAGAGIALLLGNAGAMGAVSLLALTGSAAIAPAVGFVLAGVLIGSLVCWLRLASPHGFKVRRDGQQPVSR